MKNRPGCIAVAALAFLLRGACAPVDTSPPAGSEFVRLDFETRIAVTNFSTELYASLGVRDGASSGPFVQTPLLPPGATFREDFLNVLGLVCPAFLDFRLLMYRRVLADRPIGLDETEAVDPVPVVAGEIVGLPACALQPLESYTVGIRDTPENVGRVRFAECTMVDDAIREAGIFPNADNAWEVIGVEDAVLAEQAPPLPSPPAPLRGRVTLADGTGIEGILVLLRTFVRVTQDCRFADDPDRVFSDPIDFTSTDASGAFALDRPAGVYQVEFFSDEFAFRPAAVTVETPLQEIVVIAEPI